MTTAKRIHHLKRLPSVSTNKGQADRLRGILTKALQDAMAVGFGIGIGLGMAGCSSESESEITGGGGTAGTGGNGGIGGSTSKQPTICESASRDLGCDPRQVMPDFARFETGHEVQYWATGVGHKIYREQGLSCAQTGDPAGCQTQIDSALAAFVLPAEANCFNPGCSAGETFILARGSKGVFIMKTQQELATFLAPIENVAEANAVAQFFDRSVLQCNDKRAGVSCAGDSFSVVAYQDICGNENKWLKVKIPHSGAAPTTEVIERVPANCAIGRVPDGCETQTRGSKQWASIADFWSDCAGLEAASVPAFYLLAEDLRALGAPAELINEALKSAEDEMRHAAEVFRLAVQAGGQSQDVIVPARAPKSLFEMAHENAVEGCVRETFGAFVAAYQARTATNPEARLVLVRIAEDELKHAALSHEIAAWAEPQLTDQQRFQIKCDRRQLVAQLRNGVSANHAAEIYADAGYPGAEAATRMLDVLEGSLWSRVA